MPPRRGVHGMTARISAAAFDHSGIRPQLQNNLFAEV